MSIAHRPAVAADRNFILKSWIASYRDSDTAGFILDRHWYDVMWPMLTEVLELPGVQATVAYETTDPGSDANLYGFIVADPTESPPLVFYCFVKAAYRRAGLARGLFAAVGIDPAMPFRYVCSTPSVFRLRRKIPMARWMPRLGRFPKFERKRSA